MSYMGYDPSFDRCGPMFLQIEWFVPSKMKLFEKLYKRRMKSLQQ